MSFVARKTNKLTGQGVTLPLGGNGMKAATFHLVKEIVTIILKADRYEPEITLYEDDTIEIKFMDEMYLRKDGE